LGGKNIHEILGRKVNEFTGETGGWVLSSPLDGRFSKSVEALVDAYMNREINDVKRQLLSIVNSSTFKYAVDKTIEETAYWCIRRVHGLGGYSDKSILNKRLQAIRGAYPLTALVRHLIQAYCDNKGHTFEKRLVLVQVAQVVLGESLRKGKHYIGVIQLSPGDIEDIVKHYWRKQGLKDNDLLREAIVLGIFVNILAHYLLEEEPVIYGKIIEDTEKKVKGFMGVEQG